jgi:hypothetical protein
MQTIRFACPHCKNLMAVGTNLLGRNVRCPHCKQVLQAPGGAAPPAPPAAPAPGKPGSIPEFQLPQTAEEHESIFAEAHDDDVFSRSPPKPVLPPVEPEETPTVLSESLRPNPIQPTAVDTPAGTTSVPWQPRPGETTPHAPDPWPKEPEPPHPTAPPASQPSEQEPPGEESSLAAPHQRRRVLTWLLLAWALAATGTAIYLLASGSGRTGHPFEEIPDFFGEYDKADRKKTSFKGMPSPEEQVPPQLRVPLGGSIRVVQLQVEPLAVEKRYVDFYRQSAGGAPSKLRKSEVPVHVLRLKVKNVSDDVVFCPNDPAFNRRYKSDPQASKESLLYNALLVGSSTRIRGGPFYWPPIDTSVEREFVDGQENDTSPLRPGQVRETVICTLPGERIDDAMQKSPSGPCLWRVQLRTGLVRVPDRSGAERDVSVTSVIGVEFKPSDVQNKVAN